MTQRRPDTYTSINTNTQRTGLPSQSHKIVFLTSDTLSENAHANEVIAVYDSAGADIATGNRNSIASRMVDAALKVTQGVDMSVSVNDKIIKCIASSIIINNEKCKAAPYVLSFSVNNSEIKTITRDADETDTVAKLLIQSLQSEWGVVPTTSGGNYFISAPLISSSTTISEKEFILSGIEAGINDEIRHNFLRILPTPGEANDMYEYIVGAPPDGVEIHSCSTIYVPGV